MSELLSAIGFRASAGNRLVRKLIPLALVLSLLLPPVCAAHVGSPDVYFQGNAGPYHLVVMIRTPQMIPGVAEFEIRSDTPGIREIKIVPLYIVGEGSKYPPPPDIVKPIAGDPQFFAGKLWLMGSGSWQVRIEADGDKGSGTVAVPVPAYARNTLAMQRGLGILLFGLMLLLVVAIVSIVGAAKREGQLQSGEQPTARQKRGARLVMAATLLAVIGILALGNMWWRVSAANRADRMIYVAPKLGVTLDPTGRMNLEIGDSKWHSGRAEIVGTALIPDHGHLMHLFLVREPAMDRFYHLHPDRTGTMTFAEDLPPIASGHYKAFADIVRASGFPDTLVADIDIPDLSGKPLAGDDAEATAPALMDSTQSSTIAPLANGARMIWERDSTPLVSDRLLWFKFRVEDANGKPATDLEPYMGMAGHAEFIRSDFSVFAHVHPDGSIPMAAYDLAEATLGANSGNSDSRETQPGNMPRMAMMSPNSIPASPEVSFPYGFPKPGLYRIFIQVKRAGKIETGVFDANVN
jgi:hypothetical protein